MIQAAETDLLTSDLAVDDLLDQIDTAWVDDEFSAIIAANWPTEPPSRPRPQGPRRGATPPKIFGCARTASGGSPARESLSAAQPGGNGRRRW